jgi:AcrR family transcriptional regulator
MVLRAKPEKVEERERIRLALLRATLLLAARHGFAGLGLREVSRGAEIAPTSFYRHFADMAELGIALVDELVAPLLHDWLEQTSLGLASARLPAQVLVEQAFAAAQRDRDLMRFVLAERGGAMPSCRAALRRELAEWSAGLAPLLDDPSPHIADAVLTLLLESLSEALEDGGGAQAAIDKVEAQLTRLLAAPAERARKKP